LQRRHNGSGRGEGAPQALHTYTTRLLAIPSSQTGVQ
jgi:hypothetical protein